MELPEILAWRRKTPFEPFRVYFADGKSYAVREPGHFMVTRDHVSIGVKPVRHIPSTSVRYDLVDVRRIEPLRPHRRDGRSLPKRQ